MEILVELLLGMFLVSFILGALIMIISLLALICDLWRKE